MEIRGLGVTGVKVSVLCLGAMAFGALGNKDHDDCARIIDAAMDAGINTIDTADMYSKGESEVIVGRALRSKRSSVVLATKCFWPVGPDPNQRGLSRRHIVSAVDDSLRRLQTDWIDILYLHKPDPDTAIEESLAAATDLVASGKVRLIGTSSFPAEQLVEADRVAARRHLQRPSVEQPAYSVLARGAEADVLPLCAERGCGVMVFSPLNGGWLTGKYRRGEPPAADSRAARWPNDPSMRLDRPAAVRKFEVVDQLSDVASQSGCTLAQLALGFVLEHRAVTSAIIGPRTMSQLRDLLEGSDARLDTTALDRIDEIVAPGIDVDPADRWYRSPALATAARRRSVVRPRS
jgi:aryl-alcohol dehydrogenase-like predicted oxidoreductase